MDKTLSHQPTGVKGTTTTTTNDDHEPRRALAVNFMPEYYGVRRMRIVLDGRKAGNGNVASYFENKAYFTKRGLTKRTVLHELYHHIADCCGLEMTRIDEERNANSFAKSVINKARSTF